MPFYEREEQILKILNEYENIPLITLSEMLFVSLPTLRRDLIKLEKKGLILKKHGSVSLIKYPADTQIAFSLRAEEQAYGKVRTNRHRNPREPCRLRLRYENYFDSVFVLT